MKATLIQTSLVWEDPAANRAHFENLIVKNAQHTDLIVLPEMFTTGFTMNPEKNAEPADGPTLAWMKKLAAEQNAALAGSVAVKERGKYYNRFYWVSANGSCHTYDKRHLFRMAGEDAHYAAGSAKTITQLNGWKFCPLVCYDLRFPVWSRNRFAGDTQQWDYDVLIYVANWPEVRVQHWKQLLVARAIENQCYVIGVNRIGRDGNGYPHSGASVVIDPKGIVISSTQENEESVETVELDRDFLESYRKNFPAGLDADEFSIEALE